MTTFGRVIGVAGLLAAGWMATAPQALAAGDVERGAKLAYTCLGCHAIPNYKNTYPTYSVPKLRGQTPEYLVIALQAYRNKERSHGTMHAQAISMSDQDMADIAAYFAGPPVTSDAAAKPVGTAPEAAAVCVSSNPTAWKMMIIATRLACGTPATPMLVSKANNTTVDQLAAIALK